MKTLLRFLRSLFSAFMARHYLRGHDVSSLRSPCFHFSDERKLSTGRPLGFRLLWGERDSQPGQYRSAQVLGAVLFRSAGEAWRLMILLPSVWEPCGWPGTLMAGTRAVWFRIPHALTSAWARSHLLTYRIPAWFHSLCPSRMTLREASAWARHGASEYVYGTLAMPDGETESHRAYLLAYDARMAAYYGHATHGAPSLAWFDSVEQ